jgi:hypothetical protein
MQKDHDQPERQRLPGRRRATRRWSRISTGERQLADNPDRAEIVADLEQAIADVPRACPHKTVVTMPRSIGSSSRWGRSTAPPALRLIRRRNRTSACAAAGPRAEAAYF